MQREIIFYRKYFLDFYSKQDNRTKEKIDFVLDLIGNIERVPIKFLKYLENTDGLYEIKVVVIQQSIRIFYFFDEAKLVVLINGFIKKSKKTPSKELELAVKLKNEYFQEKNRKMK